MKRGDVIEIKLNNAEQTDDGVEGWAVSSSPGSWGRRRWIAIKDVGGEADLTGGFRVRFLGPCTGRNNIGGLLFDQRVTEPLTQLSVTHHNSWPI